MTSKIIIPIPTDDQAAADLQEAITVLSAITRAQVQATPAHLITTETAELSAAVQRILDAAGIQYQQVTEPVNWWEYITPAMIETGFNCRVVTINGQPISQAEDRATWSAAIPDRHAQQIEVIHAPVEPPQMVDVHTTTPAPSKPARSKTHRSETGQVEAQPVTTDQAAKHCPICGKPTKRKTCGAPDCQKEYASRYSKTHRIKKLAEQVEINAGEQQQATAPDQAQAEAAEVAEFEQILADEIAHDPADELPTATGDDEPDQPVEPSVEPPAPVQSKPAPVPPPAVRRTDGTTYVVVDGERKGTRLSSYQLDTMLRANTLQPGQLLRHDVSGLYKVVQGSNRQKLLPVNEGNPAPFPVKPEAAA